MAKNANMKPKTEIRTTSRRMRAAESVSTKATEKNNAKAKKCNAVVWVANGSSEMVRGMPETPAISAILPNGTIWINPYTPAAYKGIWSLDELNCTTPERKLSIAHNTAIAATDT